MASYSTAKISQTIFFRIDEIKYLGAKFFTMRITSIVCDLLKSKKTILFCGAGISFRSGIPVVKGFLEYLLSKIGVEQHHISEYVNSQVPFESTVEIIRRFVDITLLLQTFDNNNPNINHELIANLIRDKFLSVVITTNFDENIETALVKLNLIKDRDFLVYSDINAMPSVIISNMPVILKVHGTISNVNSLLLEIQKVATKKIFLGWKGFLITCLPKAIGITFFFGDTVFLIISIFLLLWKPLIKLVNAFTELSIPRKILSW